MLIFTLRKSTQPKQPRKFAKQSNEVDVNPYHMFLEHLNANMAREFCGKLQKIELHAHLNGSLNVSTITQLRTLHELSFPNEEVPNVSDITIGQAHDMFSRIYRIRIYKFFLQKIM